MADLVGCCSLNKIGRRQVTIEIGEPGILVPIEDDVRFGLGIVIRKIRIERDCQQAGYIVHAAVDQGPVLGPKHDIGVVIGVDVDPRGRQARVFEFQERSRNGLPLGE